MIFLKKKNTEERPPLHKWVKEETRVAARQGLVCFDPWSLNNQYSIVNIQSKCLRPLSLPFTLDR